jgi:hypothetical protein
VKRNKAFYFKNKKRNFSMQRTYDSKNGILVYILILTILFPAMRISAEDSYIHIRVTDANFPPKTRVYEDLNFTRFSFDMDYQIVNPTQSEIIITFSSSPFPFPRLKTNLENKTLDVYQAFIIEPVPGEYALQPGIKNESFLFSIEIDNYIDENLPLGRYELWFDYTNTSSSPVPVETKKMLIHVSDTNISYTFEHSNEIRIVSSIQETNLNLEYYLIPWIVVTFFSLRRINRRNSNSNS